jgi:hypothetical protein
MLEQDLNVSADYSDFTITIVDILHYIHGTMYEISILYRIDCLAFVNKREQDLRLSTSYNDFILHDVRNIYDVQNDYFQITFVICQ